MRDDEERAASDSKKLGCVWTIRKLWRRLGNGWIHEDQSSCQGYLATSVVRMKQKTKRRTRTKRPAAPWISPTLPLVLFRNSSQESLIDRTKRRRMWRGILTIVEQSTETKVSEIPSFGTLAGDHSTKRRRNRMIPFVLRSVLFLTLSLPFPLSLSLSLLISLST